MNKNGRSLPLKVSVQVRQSLRNSFIEGTFCSVFVGFTEQYITPFALVLKTTNAQIGILAVGTGMPI
ncbi:hypothetical protein KAS42_00910 [bacterium]|nr:hypothetical protein [bacterium]